MCYFYRMRLLLIVFAAAIILLSAACRKSDRDLDNSLRASKDQVIADQLTFDLFILIDEACRKEWSFIPALTTGKLDCAAISSNLTGFPKTVSISFGAIGCITADGRMRKGTVVVQIYGEYGDPSTNVTVSTSNYGVDEYLLNGNHTFVCNGPNADNEPEYMFTYTGLTLIDSLNRKLTYDANRTRVLSSGASTLEVSDDIYRIGGNSSGRSRSGNLFSTKLTSSLIQEASCRYIVSGNMEVTPNNIAVRYVDFGTQCDSNVTVTINNTLYYLAQD